MPRNSTGTYTLPISAFSPGGVIKASDHNSNYSDIATALTQSLATNGVSIMTGQFKAAQGNNVAPSISFANAATTGFYLAGADQIGWTAAGVAYGTLNANGSVSLSGAVTIGGALAVTGALTVGGSAVTIFASGTRMYFAQAAAPTGWTQVVTYNDYAIRLVSGAGGGTGGTKAFSTIFSASITNLAQHNHGTTEAAHSHSYLTYTNQGTAGYGGGFPSPILSTGQTLSTGTASTGLTINNAGSGATTAFDINYLDTILCSKT
jgi:hypothetical protein